MKTKVLLALGLTLIVLGCAGSLPTLKEPVEGKNLIIGSVIFENRGYQDRNEIYFDNIDVAIIGIYKKNGTDKIFGKWTRTDKNGYFFISNVPDGKYALKAIRVNLSGQAYITIANEFRTLVDNYKLWPSENITFSGDKFNTRPNKRIVNLKHNYFTFFHNREIRYSAYDKIDQFQASSGDVVSRPMIFKYFINQYPESSWKQYLQAVLDTYKY